MELLSLYLILINAAALLFMLTDKLRAKQYRWRIPEATLMGIAAAGGSFGAYVGMKLFRHKTRHPKFAFGIPALLAVHVILLVLIVPKLA
jgi:uncharacterized membrane protein YsdA (DUF1294 family)